MTEDRLDLGVYIISIVQKFTEYAMGSDFSSGKIGNTKRMKLTLIRSDSILVNNQRASNNKVLTE